ncbi:hypothetical protein NLJ89_g520 [Agrocybe chaxingu]|uniref:Hydrophobin n=1 Tax=Agrocybe chaxingu TaxID=84603 RepID=A0A9W8TEY3_9AGAR|nr:hypothetical protein NLJ89_g520 [Agrocybe chaxingu]
MVAIKSLAILSLPFMVMASPLVPRTDSPSQCNNGSLQCCNSSMTQSPSNLQQLPELLGGALGGLLGGLLGLGGLGGLVGLADINALIGVTCTDVPIVGGTNTCTQQTVCCSNNNFNGVIALGCTPFNIGL